MTKQQDTRELTTSDGDVFELTVSKLEVLTAYALVARLGSLLAPAAVAMKQGKESDLQPVLDQLFKTLTPELAQQVLVEMLSTTTVVHRTPDGAASKHELLRGKTEINNAFRGNLKTMFRAAGFAFEVNFSDFFDVSGLVAQLTPTPSA